MTWPVPARGQTSLWYDKLGEAPPQWAGDPAPRSRAMVALSLRWLHYPEWNDVGGGLVVTLPTDGMAPVREPHRRKAKEPDGDKQPRPPPRPARADPDESAAASVRVSGQDARNAVAAAIRHAAIARDEARLAQMAARARYSSALPQLRLRALRIVREQENLIPTEYDPWRQTMMGGSSLWLEARATWSLDRAIFSEEEVRLERIERDVEAERERLERRVLDLLFGWQESVLDRLDPASSARECRRATLHEQQFAAELDMLTHGWFSAWRAHRPTVPETDCGPIAAQSVNAP